MATQGSEVRQCGAPLVPGEEGLFVASVGGVLVSMESHVTGMAAGANHQVDSQWLLGFSDLIALLYSCAAEAGEVRVLGEDWV